MVHCFLFWLADGHYFLWYCLLWMVTAHCIPGLVRVILEYVLMLLWSFAEAPDFSGGRGEMAMAAPPRCFFPYAVQQTFSLWSLYSDNPLSSRPQPLGSGGDATPCEDTREDLGPSFLLLSTA